MEYPTEIKIQGVDAQDLAEKVIALAKVFGAELISTRDPNQLALPLEEQHEATDTKQKKPKKTKPEAREEIAPEPITESEPARTTLSVGAHDVRAALKKVNDLKGLERAKEILADFDCAKVSALKESQYSDFVEACEQALS